MRLVTEFDSSSIVERWVKLTGQVYSPWIERVGVFWGLTGFEFRLGGMIGDRGTYG